MSIGSPQPGYRAVASQIARLGTQGSEILAEDTLLRDPLIRFGGSTALSEVAGRRLAVKLPDLILEDYPDHQYVADVSQYNEITGRLASDKTISVPQALVLIRPDWDEAPEMELAVKPWTDGRIVYDFKFDARKLDDPTAATAEFKNLLGSIGIPFDPNQVQTKDYVLGAENPTDHSFTSFSTLDMPPVAQTRIAEILETAIPL